MTTPSYEALLKQYAHPTPCPPDFSFPTHVLDSWTLKQPAALAIHWVSADFKEERKVTYADLTDLSKRCAFVLKGLGVGKGDRVMVQLPRVVEWWVVIFGLMRIGAIPIPGTSLLVAKDLKFRATASNAIAFIGDTSACARFEEISASVGVSRIIQVRTPDDLGLGKGRIDLQKAIDAVRVGTDAPLTEHFSNDLAILFFTSGTTGMPKMVLLESEYTIGHQLTGHWYRLTPGKLFANMADLGWAKAAYSTFSTFNLGAALFVQPPAPGTFSPLSVLEMLHRYPITTLCAPPTIYRSLCTTSSLAYLHSNPPQALSHCVGAGEPLNPSVIREWKRETGITICDGYGQSETTIVAGNFQGIEVRLGSFGKVAPGFELAVLGPEGELGVGQEGEICVRTDIGGGSKWIFKGYLKEGKVDKRQVTFGAKTWYSTGDRGYVDKDGYYWFVGRDDDVISSAGYRIGPFEVESALKEHPAVLESAAVASPHAERGEIVCAFIILTEEYEKLLEGKGKAGEAKLTAEIQEFCRKVAAPYKYPRKIEYVKSLPKTVSGKIRRIELRDLEYARNKDIVKALKSRL